MRLIFHFPLFFCLTAPKPTLSSIWHEKGLHGRLFLVGEVIHVLRPVIYVLFIRKYGIKSWTPWLVSLVVDLTGITLVSHATSGGSNRGGRQYHLSESEKDEVSVLYFQSFALEMHR
jgi:peroxin-16